MKEPEKGPGATSFAPVGNSHFRVLAGVVGASGTNSISPSAGGATISIAAAAIKPLCMTIPNPDDRCIMKITDRSTGREKQHRSGTPELPVETLLARKRSSARGIAEQHQPVSALENDPRKPVTEQVR
ncbi:hypothetical protein [Sphingomonas sp. 37zxx]|uniref:hypothetical protein n=1 Tax=Sphingomonas sp. 37zxx TaxID=1550073 RepID=UPI001E61F7A6|nr:hypothetical protein [Sphingomonas sp. 37zxx]